MNNIYGPSLNQIITYDYIIYKKKKNKYKRALMILKKKKTFIVL